MNLTTALGIFLRPSRSIISLIPAALLLAAVSASGAYHNFNTASGSDGIIQEVR
jgi:hypothetical protein